MLCRQRRKLEMTEKETPDAVSPENAANLLKLEEEL